MNKHHATPPRLTIRRVRDLVYERGLNVCLLATKKSYRQAANKSSRHNEREDFLNSEYPARPCPNDPFLLQAAGATRGWVSMSLGRWRLYTTRKIHSYTSTETRINVNEESLGSEWFLQIMHGLPHVDRDTSGLLATAKNYQSGWWRSTASWFWHSANYPAFPSLLRYLLESPEEYWWPSGRCMPVMGVKYSEDLQDNSALKVPDHKLAYKPDLDPKSLYKTLMLTIQTIWGFHLTKVLATKSLPV